jgi:hypothetical protein
MFDDDRIWRVGEHYGIHVYAVNQTDEDDEPVCTASTREFAEQIVIEHNKLC